MNNKFTVECAVWHPRVAASAIAGAVGLVPRIGWSVGDPDRSTGRPQDRTYCRFRIGDFSQEQISEGMTMLEPFSALFEMPSFHDGRGIIAVYFRAVDDAPELVINVQGLQMILDLKASVVIW